MTSFDPRSSFDEETFEDLDLQRADMRGREFVRCVFRRVKFGESTWADTRLEDCSFEHCDLTRANVSNLALREVAFEHCKLMGIDWSYVSSFPAASFSDCNMHYVSMVQLALRKTRFVRCSFVEANLIKTDLTEAVFEECAFTGARFEECDLRKASFADARDLFIDPSKHNVKGARIPVESAVLLATSFGMQVFGYSQGKSKAGRSK